jgi:hypothetical protein
MEKSSVMLLDIDRRKNTKTKLGRKVEKTLKPLKNLKPKPNRYIYITYMGILANFETGS